MAPLQISDLKFALFLMALVVGPPVSADEPTTRPLRAPKFGVVLAVPESWPVVVREREDTVFAALVPRDDPDRPGVVACELALAPENLDEYRTRIDGNARRGNRPGKLVRNEVVQGPNGDRLVTVWEFHPRPDELWIERSVRLIANRQMYTFLINADEKTYARAEPHFDALIDSAAFRPPDTGADPADGDDQRNRWVQREFKFAIDLPDGWQPALAPAEVALFYANGPAHGIWADNCLVIAHPHDPKQPELEELARILPDQLRAVEPGCEVIRCEVVTQGPKKALETVVQTQRGPFSMTVVERRFRGDRFDYEVKYTLESKRLDDLLPTIRKSLDSFEEVPGDVPALGKPA